MKTFLHVGCGRNRKEQTTKAFAGSDWTELRFDIDPAAEPDIVGTMTDMSALGDLSVDALYSAHNIEHLYPHEVPLAFAEFRRVLKPEGFVVITCPDLQSIAALIADDKLMEEAYRSPAGPITPLDMLFGFRPQLAAGNHFMAHRCGFTRKVLDGTLTRSGFATVASLRRDAPHFDLWALAGKSPIAENEIRKLAEQHFP